MLTGHAHANTDARWFGVWRLAAREARMALEALSLALSLSLSLSLSLTLTLTLTLTR